jgi:hypothetical protein
MEEKMENYELMLSNANMVIKLSSQDKDWLEEKEKKYKEFIEKIISCNPVKEPTPSSSKIKSNIVAPSEIVDDITINEYYRKFLHDKKITTLTDIAAYFMYYLTKVRKQDIVTPNDVKKLFQEVHYPNWNKINISDVMMRAKKKAFLNSHDNSWSLTITGEDFVLNSMSESDAE